jgi:hypothetical protein
MISDKFRNRAPHVWIQRRLHSLVPIAPAEKYDTRDKQQYPKGFVGS